jgi:hypothetical protein
MRGATVGMVAMMIIAALAAFAAVVAIPAVSSAVCAMGAPRGGVFAVRQVQAAECAVGLVFVRNILVFIKSFYYTLTKAINQNQSKEPPESPPPPPFCNCVKIGRIQQSKIDRCNVNTHKKGSILCRLDIVDGGVVFGALGGIGDSS